MPDVVNLDTLISTLQGSNQIMSRLVQTISQIFPRVTGTFTLAAAASTTVTQPSTAANSIILLMPTNAAAGTLMGSAKSLYVSARTAGASFTVATASGVAAAGTETFAYCIVNPS